MSFTVRFINSKNESRELSFDKLHLARLFCQSAPLNSHSLTIHDPIGDQVIERYRTPDTRPEVVENWPDDTPKAPGQDIKDGIDRALGTVHNPLPASAYPLPQEEPVVEAAHPVEPAPWTEQQRRAIFGPITEAVAKHNHIRLNQAQELIKDMMITRGMIKDSRTELTKENATKVIDGLCKRLNLQLDSPWNC